ncbi:hypothetical protein E2C01_047556 [Portunus trituberculatus]|uniref:Uncharacterized protein n=1 Tax=Portunus trituberculatus TaxID=210409 RepID=A0A5B7G980_PORTR|nr:hypothetical protein [Portunus trituberculatus]
MSERGYEVHLNPNGKLATRGEAKEPKWQKPGSAESSSQVRMQRGRVGHTTTSMTAHHTAPTVITIATSEKESKTEFTWDKRNITYINNRVTKGHQGPI